MNQIIGIAGTSGDIKNRAAYLLGKYLHEHTVSGNCTYEQFETWYNQSLENPNQSLNLSDIYIDSFGDTILTFIGMMLGTSVSNLEDHAFRDKYLVRMSDLALVPMDQTVADDDYKSIMDFILYYGEQIMPKYFGKNVWINILHNSNKSFIPMLMDLYGGWRIFKDVRTKSEAEYIHSEEICGPILYINTGIKTKLFSVNSSNIDFKMNWKEDPKKLYKSFNEFYEFLKSVIDNI